MKARYRKQKDLAEIRGFTGASETGGYLIVQFKHDAELLIVPPSPKNIHFIAVSFSLLPKDHCWPHPSLAWPA